MQTQVALLSRRGVFTCEIYILEVGTALARSFAFLVLSISHFPISASCVSPSQEKQTFALVPSRFFSQQTTSTATSDELPLVARGARNSAKATQSPTQLNVTESWPRCMPKGYLLMVVMLGD